MQRALLAFALFASASASDMPAVFGGFSYSQHTWCGPHGGDAGYMIENFNECKHAAEIHGKGFHNSPVGQNWYAGCIVHHGTVYFTPYDRNFVANNNHRDAPSDGFYCKNQDWEEHGAFEMKDKCDAGARIQTLEDCKFAARSMSFERVGLAGTDDWEDGCIINHRDAYWVQPNGEDKAPNMHNGGSLCRVCSETDKDNCGVCFGDGSSCMPAPPPPAPPAPLPPTEEEKCAALGKSEKKGKGWSNDHCAKYARNVYYKHTNLGLVRWLKKSWCTLKQTNFRSKCPMSCCLYVLQAKNNGDFTELPYELEGKEY